MSPMDHQKPDGRGTDDANVLCRPGRQRDGYLSNAPAAACNRAAPIDTVIRNIDLIFSNVVEGAVHAVVKDDLIEARRAPQIDLEPVAVLHPMPGGPPCVEIAVDSVHGHIPGRIPGPIPNRIRRSRDGPLAAVQRRSCCLDRSSDRKGIRDKLFPVRMVF